MGVVLAIDTGRRQAKTIERLVREFHEHEVIVAGSGDDALDLFESRLPDLVVFPLFIAPGDESRMQARLQGLTDADGRQRLSIPLRAFLAWETQATRPAAVPPRWYYWFRPRALEHAAEPQVQALVDALRADLDRPRPSVAPQTSEDVIGDPAAAMARPGFELETLKSTLREAAALSESGNLTASEAEVLPPSPEQGLVLARLDMVVDVPRRSFAGSMWQLSRRLPRAVQVGLPAAAILLSLGMSGAVSEVLSPARWLAAAGGGWSSSGSSSGSTSGSTTGIAETQTVPDITGAIHIESDPQGAAVSVDGKPRGVTPLNIGGLAVGRHLIDVTMNGNVVHETVDVTAGQTARLRTSVYQGWLALFSPIELKLAVDGRALILDDQNRALLPSGRHQLTLQSRALGYSATHSIDIKPGATTPLSVVLPKTTLTVTTSSAAEILIDGEAAGSAPLTEVPVEIGTRQITARSAEHGDRHATVVATTAPVSLSIDFSSPAP